jgi:hypothetical protein
VGGTDALMSARIDPRFAPYHDDPRFQLLLNPPTNAPATNRPATAAPQPAKK